MRWMNRGAAVAAVVTLAALLPRTAAAWNDHGHMMVAAIAYKKLHPAVRAKVDRLVALNPDYATWVVGVAPAQRGLVAFMVASTWPDAIKHDGHHTNDGNRPVGPDAARNIGYKDDLQHRYWHFIDLPFSVDGTPLPALPQPNAETQIAAFRGVLSSPAAADALKSYDLVWLLHLVGDVHQPLHCVSRVDHAHPDGDGGGNQVPLCALPCKDELHGYWDSVLGSEPDSKAALDAAAKLPAPASKPAKVLAPATWIHETFELARARAYANPPVGLGPAPVTLDAAYRREAVRVARAQVALAGARLANLLEDALH
jgi:hypothetical protein